jgi:hypothetical protein
MGAMAGIEMVWRTAKMMYTVIGVYDDGQTFADHVKAWNAEEAMRLVSKASDAIHDLQIVGAIEGEHRLIAPCESGNAAYAADLIGDDSCGSCGAAIGPNSGFPWHNADEDCRALRPPVVDEIVIEVTE